MMFQQKKKGRKKKRKTDTSDSGSSLSASLGLPDADSSEATLPRSGNVSPLPFDDPGVPRSVTTESGGLSVSVKCVVKLHIASQITNYMYTIKPHSRSVGPGAV